MLFNRKWKSNRSFSVMLAEEVLRGELKALYGEGIKIFQCDMRGYKGGLVPVQDETDSLMVCFTAIIGPFERLYPENSESDKRRRLRRVEATVYVYKTEGSVIAWHVRNSVIRVIDDSGILVHDQLKFYRHGFGDENPCEDMCTDQTDVNYPMLYPHLHGQD